MMARFKWVFRSSHHLKNVVKVGSAYVEKFVSAL